VDEAPSCAAGALPLADEAVGQLYRLVNEGVPSHHTSSALIEALSHQADYCVDLRQFDRAMELGTEMLEAVRCAGFIDSSEAREFVVEALETLTAAARENGLAARAAFFGRQLVPRARELAEHDPASRDTLSRQSIP